MGNEDKTTKKLDEPPRIGTDEDFRCIEEAAGIEAPNELFRERLVACVELCCHPSHSDIPNVRDAVFIRAVKRITADAERLLNDLTGRDFDDGSEDAWAYEYATISLGLSGEDELFDGLRELIDTAHETRKLSTGFDAPPSRLCNVLRGLRTLGHGLHFGYVAVVVVSHLPVPPLPPRRDPARPCCPPSMPQRPFFRDL